MGADGRATLYTRDATRAGAHYLAVWLGAAGDAGGGGAGGGGAGASGGGGGAAAALLLLPVHVRPAALCLRNSRFSLASGAPRAGGQVVSWLGLGLGLGRAYTSLFRAPSLPLTLLHNTPLQHPLTTPPLTHPPMIPSYTLALSLAPTPTLTLTSQVVLRIEGLDRFANEIAQTKGTAGGAAAGGGAGGGGGGAGGGGAVELQLRQMEGPPPSRHPLGTPRQQHQHWPQPLQPATHAPPACNHMYLLLQTLRR